MISTLAVAAALLVASPATAATDHHWSGYRIDGPGKAAGSWIGGYRLANGAKTYRLSPTSAAPKGRLAPVRKTTGRAGATRREVARAAYILSKYGNIRNASRSASVDAAALHLLAGGRWRVGARCGADRIRQTGPSKRVRRQALAMLAESKRGAGPYRVTLAAADAVRPGGFRVRVTVHTATGRPVVGAPVRVIVNGVGNVLARTRPNGAAVALWSKTNGIRLGRHRGRVEVRQLIENRLILRRPASGSTLAVGGWKRAIIRSTQMVVRKP